MNRRQFLGTGAAATAASLFSPQSLFSKAAKQRNQARFPQPLEPEVTIQGAKEFHIFVDIVQHEIVPGANVHMLAFNGQVPGPEIRVNEGDQVRVVFENRTQMNHTIHWHGLYSPWRHDGVPFVTQMPTMPDMEFVYEFEAKPYGTHWYHCHWGTVLHAQVGMYGPIIIEPKEGQPDPIREQFDYDREYTFMYSAHDTNFIRSELNEMLERMKERTYLMKNGRFDRKRFGVFADEADLRAAMDDGYQPPYLNNRRAPSGIPDPNYFTINGKSYPSTPKLYITEDENIRVRLINSGTEPHSLHMHGYDFWEVSDDGIPIEHPRQMNTILLAPGKSHDIIVEGKNRGIWTFHDHDTRRATNNGVYPGGTLTTLVYEDLPEEERKVYGPMSGLRMQGGEMEGMDHSDMDGKGMQGGMASMQGDGNMGMHDLDGLDKLPFVALDE